MNETISRGAGGRGWRRALPQLFAAALLLGGAALAIPAAWMPAKAALAQVLLERNFEANLATGHNHRPWPWADISASARLTVDRLGVSDIVLSGASGEAMAFGPAEFPTRQHGRLKLLAAHRDSHFAWMRKLKVGDRIELEGVDGFTTQYEVTRMETVEWDRFAVPAQLHRETLVLATCYPFDASGPGPLRRIAIAERIA
ncbi:class GN sortase [Qipengyuania sphaerica]|uniref:class GN sortase n=1 Tax=Qipengyuania sphaerica TaxID=2867243 RepID=UPI001C88456B|nr:class GN sortase [Qipengyuania sphaerica]MBX7539903.1 class GN sortase [Qipengyuania sphaerica]